MRNNKLVKNFTISEFFNTIKNKKKLCELCGKKKRTKKKSTKYDKQDTAYAPFRNAQNFYKSSSIALQNF